jgi:FG-GAP repeat
VAAGDVNGDGVDDVITGAGTSRVARILSRTGLDAQPLSAARRTSNNPQSETPSPPAAAV